MGRIDTPGPGAYETLKQSKGGVTISGHKGRSRVEDTPGPGQYDPADTGTRVRPSSAKYHLHCDIASGNPKEGTKVETKPPVPANTTTKTEGATSSHIQTNSDQKRQRNVIQVPDVHITQHRI